MKWADGGFKIISNGDGLFGTTGALDASQDFMKWVLDDMDPAKFPKIEKGELSGIGIIDGDILEWGNSETPFVLKTEYMAWGSGKEVAVGALGAGSGALEAVAVACKHSPGTDWPVQVLIAPYQTKGEPCGPFLISRKVFEDNYLKLINASAKDLFEILSKQTTTRKTSVPRVPIKRRRSKIPKTRR